MVARRNSPPNVCARPRTGSRLHLDFELPLCPFHVLHGVDRDLRAAKVNVSQVVTQIRKLPGSRVADLRVPELNPLQVFALSERLDTRVGDVRAAVQANEGQVGARVRQRFETRISDVRVGEPDLFEEGARSSNRSYTRVGDLRVVAVASALILVLPRPLDQRVVVGGRCCWRRRRCW